MLTTPSQRTPSSSAQLLPWVVLAVVAIGGVLLWMAPWADRSTGMMLPGYGEAKATFWRAWPVLAKSVMKRDSPVSTLLPADRTLSNRLPPPWPEPSPLWHVLQYMS